MNPRNFTATQAAILHSEYPLANSPDPASLPAMIWGTNYGRLISQTVFTLFFAGRDFAPECIIDGKNIQDYLQEHFIEAVGKLVDRIRDAGDLLDECVIGWDSMNEPSEGFCGCPDLNTYPSKQGSILKKGTCPTPAQSLRLGMGQAQTVDHWTFGTFGPYRDGTMTVDPKGIKIWSDPDTEVDGVHPKWGWKRDPCWALGTCLWAQHGVWDIETGFVLLPQYFTYFPGEKPGQVVEFIADYWRPHWQAYAKRIRASHPEAILFVHPPVFARPPPLDEDDLRGRCAYSTHYYDGLTLVTRHWNWFNADALGLLRGKYPSKMAAVKIGEASIRKSLREQLAMLKGDATILGAYPTVIGEIGIPFDMDGKRSYGWTDNGKYKGDYSRQVKALDASLNGADGTNALSWAVWTYCPDGGHDWGDGWNMEDLSLWCPDDLRGGPQESAMFAARHASMAGLLQKTLSNGSADEDVTITAATTAVSLPTLGLNGAAVVPDDVTLQKASAKLLGWHDNPYDFLTDGARAVQAFSRPYPRKVVGTPKDLAFDIPKATFKLTVVVRSDDKLRTPVDADGEELATEIFVPLVHFAHSNFLPLDVSSERLEDVSEQTSGSVSQIGSHNASTITLTKMQPSASSLLDLNKANGSPLLSGGRPSSQTMLDLQVRVSEGRWAVEGQVLKWWYDVPTEGEGEREYVIEIKRRGGAIRAQVRKETVWEQCCSDSYCCIM